MPTADLNGLMTYYQVDGAGEPLVFVHGLGLDHRIFDDQIAFFRRSYQTVAYDLRGHGLSAAPETGYSYQHFADDLKALVAYLALRSFHLVGLSMGGAIAARYLLENPGRARSITFVDAHIVGYTQFANWPNLFKIARTQGAEPARTTWKAFRLFDSFRHDPVKRQRLEQMVERFSCAYWLDPSPRYAETDDLARIAQIDVPALAVIGTGDADFLPIAHLLRDRLPHCRFELFDGGHLVSFEQPERFNARMLDFLKSLPQ